MKITINDHVFHPANNWNVLSDFDLRAVYRILHTPLSRLVLSDRALQIKRIALTQQLLHLSPDFLHAWRQDRLHEFPERGDTVYAGELDELARAVCAPFLAPVSKEQPDQYQVTLGLTRCPTPKIAYPATVRKQGTRQKVTRYLYAPADALANVSFYELATTFALFEGYLADPEESRAERLLATLFRKTKPRTKENLAAEYHGDIRRPLLHEERSVTGRLDIVRTLSVADKQLLLFWFASCRQTLITKYPRVFHTASEDTPRGLDYGWSGVMMELAGEVTKLDEVSSQNAETVLTYISYLADKDIARRLNTNNS